jgi:hypothetical protein
MQRYGYFSIIQIFSTKFHKKCKNSLKNGAIGLPEYPKLASVTTIILYLFCNRNYKQDKQLNETSSIVVNKG